MLRHPFMQLGITLCRPKVTHIFPVTLIANGTTQTILLNIVFNPLLCLLRLCSTTISLCVHSLIPSITRTFIVFFPGFLLKVFNQVIQNAHDLIISGRFLRSLHILLNTKERKETTLHLRPETSLLQVCTESRVAASLAQHLSDVPQTVGSHPVMHEGVVSLNGVVDAVQLVDGIHHVLVKQVLIAILYTAVGIGRHGVYQLVQDGVGLGLVGNVVGIHILPVVMNHTTACPAAGVAVYGLVKGNLHRQLAHLCHHLLKQSFFGLALLGADVIHLVE